MFKPLAGVLDLTTNTLKGIGNTAGFLLDGKQKELRAVRPKRFIHPGTGVITAYNFSEAARHDPAWQKEEKERAKEEQQQKSAEAAATAASSSALATTAKKA